MAKGTIRGIHSILSGAFEAAMRWEWTDRNPAGSARPPTPSRQTILATSPEAVAKVIAEARARSAALGLYLWLVVVTGVRRGELCGLQIRDVDLERALVHIAFNYVVRGGRRVRKDTKTHQDRWLAIDPITCALIASYLAKIRAELAAVGVELGDDAYLFSNDPAHARPWNPDWVTHRVSELATAAGVELDIKGGRHYTASRPASASSSRSQVAVSTVNDASCLTWVRSSVSIRSRPLLALAIVTHLVTRLRAGFGAVTWMQTTSAALLAVKRCSLAWGPSDARDGHSVSGCCTSWLYRALGRPPVEG